MELPTNWASSVNCRAALRGDEPRAHGRAVLPAFEGMSLSPRRVGDSAAASESDASASWWVHRSYWTSNWAGGVGSALESIYLWMYDDGPGSPNADCQAGNMSGCWGHRDDILGAFTCSPCVVGAAASRRAYEGQPSWAELMARHLREPGARFSLVAGHLARSSSTVVGMTAEASQGYWLVTACGTVRSFGGAPYYGSATDAGGLEVVGMRGHT